MSIKGENGSALRDEDMEREVLKQLMYQLAQQGKKGSITWCQHNTHHTN